MNNFEDDYLKTYERLYIRQKYYLSLAGAVSESNYAGLPYEGKLLQQQLLRMALEMLDEAKQDFDNLVTSKRRKVMALNQKIEEFKKRHNELIGDNDYEHDDSSTGTEQ